MNLTSECNQLEIKHKKENYEMKSAYDQAEYQKALNDLGIDIYYDAPKENEVKDETIRFNTEGIQQDK